MTAPRCEAPPRVLLVEDDPGDALLAREAFQRCGASLQMDVVQDGEAALAFLRGSGTLPDLVLLDLNLPRKDGFEVLAELKSDPALRSLPVLVLTTSDSAQDVLRAYQLHANCYMTKPADVAEFQTLAELIDSFWLRRVRLPTGSVAARAASVLESP